MGNNRVDNPADLSGPSESQAGGVLRVPWVDGMEPPIFGYDSASRTARKSPFAESRTFSAGGSGVSQDIQIRRVETVDDLHDALRIEGGASGAYQLFSASSAAAFTRNVSMNAYSIYFLVKSVAIGNPQYSEPALAQFRPDASSAVNPSEFRKQYGDYFVSGRIKGSALFALLEVKTESNEVKQTVLTSLGAKYGPAGKNLFETSFSSALRTAASHAGVSLSLQIATQGVGPGLIGNLSPTTREAPVDEPDSDVDDDTDDDPETEDDSGDSEAADGDTPTDGDDAGEEDDEEKLTVGDIEQKIGGQKSTIARTDLGAQDALISTLIEAAGKLPEHVQTYGKDMFALVTPFANHPDSPLRDIGFNADRLEAIYDRLRRVYTRAKFIYDSAVAAQAIEDRAGKTLFNLPAGKTLATVADEMLAILNQVATADQALRNDPRAEVPQIAIPALRDYLPERLWIGSETKFAPPKKFDFNPAALVDLSHAAQEQFLKMEGDFKYQDFQSACVKYCQQIHEDIRRSLIEITGFIADLQLAFSELPRGGLEMSDVTDELRNRFKLAKSGLKSRIADEESKFSSLEKRAERIPKEALFTIAEEGNRRQVSAKGAIDSLKDLNYNMGGGGGDAGPGAFYEYTSASLENVMKILANLPSSVKLDDYVEFDDAEWNRLKLRFADAGKGWQGAAAVGADS